MPSMPEPPHSQFEKIRSLGKWSHGFHLVVSQWREVVEMLLIITGALGYIAVGDYLPSMHKALLNTTKIMIIMNIMIFSGIKKKHLNDISCSIRTVPK